jgi:hypothetical protein
MDLKSLIESAKHVVCEEDPHPTTKPTTTVTKAVHAPLPTPSFITTPATPANGGFTALAGTDNHFYDVLFNKTNFDNTDVGKRLTQFTDALKAVATDERTKLLSAIALSKLSANDILQAIESLASALLTEEQHFTASAVERTASQVTERQTNIQKKQQEIARLNNEIAQLSNEAVEQQGIIQHTQSDFSLALNRRHMELEQLKQHYTTLLQGYQG